MPRAAWVADGAVVAAIVASTTASAGVPGPLLSLALLAAAAICALASRSRPGPGRGSVRGDGGARLLPLLVGVVLVAVRILVGGPGSASTIGLPETMSGDGPWLASVIAVGSPRDGRQTATVELRSERPDGADSAIRIAATLPRYPAIRPGQLIRIGGRLEMLGDDDYGRYLAGSGVSATVRASDLAVVGEEGDAGDRIESLRRGADDALTRALPEPEAGLASGILIGLRDRVDRDLAAAFVAAGVSHV
ncbi:MAG: hypothetical protein ACHQ3P_09940, partial [Candidatus Limnocylindrales bacterium]